MFTRPAWLEPRTAYIHIPFCAHRCGYCDFAISVGHDDQIALYLEALELELNQLKTPRPVETLYVGGGTPTYLDPKQLNRLFQMVNQWFPRGSQPGLPEVSIESTPDTLDAERCAVLAEAGVTRISIGVQSFQPHLLKSLDRRHSREQIPRSVELVRQHVPSFSLDLIFAAPGATLADWLADLQEALSYDPQHISTYGLTYEKGTPLWKQRERGDVRPVPEEAELEMYLAGIDFLTAAGFEHYEVSNFAKPGHRSRHNGRYWANEAYYGVGVGAARYVEGSRELNVRNTQDYMRKVLSGESPTFQEERLAGRERALETVAVQLRRMEGVSRAKFQEQTGEELNAVLGDRLTHLVKLGLLQDDGESVRLTRKGLALADGVIEDVMTHCQE
jgi:oxygen-independent coproporphyrinogen-3 oxidase